MKRTAAIATAVLTASLAASGAAQAQYVKQAKPSKAQAEAEQKQQQRQSQQQRQQQAINSRVSGHVSSQNSSRSLAKGGQAKSDSDSNSRSSAANTAKTGDNQNRNNNHAYNGDHTSNQIVKDGDTNVRVNGGDTVSHTTTYQETPNAHAGYVSTMLEGCFGIGGTDARGAGLNAAGGLSFSFNTTNGDCVRLGVAQQEEAKGNLENAAKLRCKVRSIRKAFGKFDDCVEALYTVRPAPVVEHSVHVAIEPVQCPDLHPHKANEHGILIYDGVEYKETGRSWPEIQNQLECK